MSNTSDPVGVRPRVLVIGPDRYVMEACGRLGLDAVVVCGSKDWDAGLIQIPGRLRLVRVEDQANPEHVLAALHRAGLAASGFDAVQSSVEYALVCAALLAEHFGCRTPGAATATRMRDKSLQKARIAAAGLRTARSTVIEDVYDVGALEKLPYERAVLKPLAGAGTARTTVVEDLHALRGLSRSYAAQGIAQRVFVLEEFVPGEEWVVDGVVFEGQLLFAGVGAYREPCLAAVDGELPLTMRRFDPVQDAGAYAAALPMAAAALAALGLRDGVFHMELFHDPATGQLTFGECAGRRGGALIHEEIQAKFGVHLGECALDCALGRRPRTEVRLRPGAVGSGYLPARPGLLVACPTPAQLCELPGVEFARIEAPYGALFGESIGTTNERVGMVLVAAETGPAMEARMSEARTWFSERLVVAPVGARPRELRQWAAATWPDADFADRLWT